MKIINYFTQYGLYRLVSNMLLMAWEEIREAKMVGVSDSLEQNKTLILFLFVLIQLLLA